MKDWYLKMMIESHRDGRIDDRNNYAKMAGLNTMEMMELCGKQKKTHKAHGCKYWFMGECYD